ncbi:hypothetical protein A4G19_08555 [Pasteurellaceae bacterium Macca]|nr:hypothetical protein [Pasteurellaceae bacterium Macca]
MLKPDLLRQVLSNSVPLFRTNPDKLQLYFDGAKIHATGAETPSFEYRYNLIVIVEDYPCHPDTLIVPVVEFLRQQQSELFDNPDKRKQGIAVELDINNHDTFDIQLTLPLTERVVVSESHGEYQVEHKPEPTPYPYQEVINWRFSLKGEEIFTHE